MRRIPAIALVISLVGMAHVVCGGLKMEPDPPDAIDPLQQHQLRLEEMKAAADDEEEHLHEILDNEMDPAREAAENFRPVVPGLTRPIFVRIPPGDELAEREFREVAERLSPEEAHREYEAEFQAGIAAF